MQLEPIETAALNFRDNDSLENYVAFKNTITAKVVLDLIALVKRQEQELADQPVQQPAPAPAFDVWYHRKTHMSREHAQIAFDAGYAALVAAVAALAWKWHRESVKQGFACSEPAQELFEVLGWPDDPAMSAPANTDKG